MRCFLYSFSVVQSPGLPVILVPTRVREWGFSNFFFYFGFGEWGRGGKGGWRGVGGGWGGVGEA